MAPRTYRLTVRGEMGPGIREAFADLQMETGSGRTVLSGEMTDQAALYSVLERLQSLGLELVDVSLATDRDDSPPP